jgi:hypothetical protein
MRIAETAVGQAGNRQTTETDVSSEELAFLRIGACLCARCLYSTTFVSFVATKPGDRMDPMLGQVSRMWLSDAETSRDRTAGVTPSVDVDMKYRHLTN